MLEYSTDFTRNPHFTVHDIYKIKRVKQKKKKGTKAFKETVSYIDPL
jgi:hypothetical protein